MKEKTRADQLLVDLGLAENRTKAKALILAGRVLCQGKPVAKAGDVFPAGTILDVKARPAEYVSRGGLKLEGALMDLKIDVCGQRVLDVGASTGGFTDCLLQRGATHVVAVDVGYGLLDWRLRNDARVTVVERTNARNLTVETVGDGFDLAVADVSFISLTKVMAAITDRVRPGGGILFLVKPQFEVGREGVGKGGVVRDPALIVQAVETVAEAARERGLVEQGRAPSRVPGPKGNLEQFLWLYKPEGPVPKSRCIS